VVVNREIHPPFFFVEEKRKVGQGPSPRPCCAKNSAAVRVLIRPQHVYIEYHSRDAANKTIGIEI